MQTSFKYFICWSIRMAIQQQSIVSFQVPQVNYNSDWELQPVTFGLRKKPITKFCHISIETKQVADSWIFFKARVNCKQVLPNLTVAKASNIPNGNSRLQHEVPSYITCTRMVTELEALDEKVKCIAHKKSFAFPIPTDAASRVELIRRDRFCVLERWDYFPSTQDEGIEKVSVQIQRWYQEQQTQASQPSSRTIQRNTLWEFPVNMCPLLSTCSALTRRLQTFTSKTRRMKCNWRSRECRFFRALQLHCKH